jgi:hypothetical protein
MKNYALETKHAVPTNDVGTGSARNRKDKHRVRGRCLRSTETCHPAAKSVLNTNHGTVLTSIVEQRSTLTLVAS